MKCATLKNRSRLKYVFTVAVAWGVAAGISVLSIMASTGPSAAGPRTAPADIASDRTAGGAATATVTGKKAKLDRSGNTQVGVASYYASKYSGRTMADGTPMRPETNNAASTTLPLGTLARVTNLRTGRSAIIVIRDRGPYVNGRIVDLSPATARLIGLQKRQGLTEVTVAPLSLPPV